MAEFQKKKSIQEFKSGDFIFFIILKMNQMIKKIDPIFYFLNPK